MRKNMFIIITLLTIIIPISASALQVSEPHEITDPAYCNVVSGNGNEIGSEIEWREASKACRFITNKPFDMDDKSQWQDALQWLYDISIKIKMAMQKYA